MTIKRCWPQGGGPGGGGGGGKPRKGKVMKQEFVCKADALLEDQEVEDAQIVISGKLPDFESGEQADCFYNEQAQKIHSILTNHVAQGIRWRLLILLMQSMQSAYKGRY